MPPVHILAANKINADTAGHTGDGGEGAAGEPAAPTPAEILHGEMNLGSVFSGGIHPEHIPAVVFDGIEKATDSVPGRLGGLKPAVGSVLAPGPAGASATRKAMLAGIPGRILGLFQTPGEA